LEYIESFLKEAAEVISRIDRKSIEKTVRLLLDVRKSGGRIFFIGAGGSAANASHAVNDFRKIAGFEAYAPTDNVSELTARTNDNGWQSVFVEWLKGSRLKPNDLLFIFSVGGGSLEKNISANIVKALQYAKETGAKICGVVGRDGGYTARVADACVLIPTVRALTVTPHTEAFQAVVWHLLVSHPLLAVNEMKWESVK
jgi:D-sedoheptulose 7-phosphate isomerase